MTKLETVAKVDSLFGDMSRLSVIDQPLPIGTEVVLRSQVEKLLAEEIRRERDLAAKQLSEVVDRMSDDYLALKAELDQAVGVIEDRSSEYEALEAKLAEKDAIIERHREAQVILGKQLDEVIADNAALTARLKESKP